MYLYIGHDNIFKFCFRLEKRSAAHSTTFSEQNVILNLEQPKEYTLNGVKCLNVTFYVTLPDGAQKSNYRLTDHVIPGNTLTMLLEEDESAITAQVRDSVAPPLTRRESTRHQNGAWKVAVAVSIVGSSLTVVFLVSVVALVYKKKR